MSGKVPERWLMSDFQFLFDEVGDVVGVSQGFGQSVLAGGVEHPADGFG